MSKQLSELIQSSNLSAEDKSVLIKIFSSLPEKLVEGLIELYKEDPRFVAVSYKLLKAKVSAFESKDEKKNAEILKQEKDLMNKVSQES